MCLFAFEIICHVEQFLDLFIGQHRAALNLYKVLRFRFPEIERHDRATDGGNGRDDLWRVFQLHEPSHDDRDDGTPAENQHRAENGLSASNLATVYSDASIVPASCHGFLRKLELRLVGAIATDYSRSVTA